MLEVNYIVNLNLVLQFKVAERQECHKQSVEIKKIMRFDTNNARKMQGNMFY